MRSTLLHGFDFELRTRLIFGPGSINQLGDLAKELAFHRTLLVADAGLVDAGHVSAAIESLSRAGIEVITFHDFDENPDSTMIDKGREFAAVQNIDSLIGLGGGSSMDCAKAINFLLTNGGVMRDYWGFGKATKPMLPMIGIPTTAGTGSEAQSYALISDAETHVKMACGDPKAAFRIAILDPSLTVSQPPSVTAITGFDAIAHAVETFVTTKHNPVSDCFSREAWRLLEANYEQVLSDPADLEARAAMQLGAYYAGVAIENSMLGATHACANPLTAHYGASHGVAIAVLLPQVVRWNEAAAGARYRELSDMAGRGEGLAERLEWLRAAGGLPHRLAELNVPEKDLATLAEEAAVQWTGSFNPRKFDAAGALEIYSAAL